MKAEILVAVLSLATAAIGQDDGQYRPEYTANYAPDYAVARNPVYKPYNTAPVYRPTAAPEVYRPASPVTYAPTYTQGPVYRILRLENEIYPDGRYHYAYDTENGISAEESGELRGTGDAAGTAAKGSYQYTSPEGILVQVTYLADEFGYHPKTILSGGPLRH